MNHVSEQSDAAPPRSRFRQSRIPLGSAVRSTHMQAVAATGPLLERTQELARIESALAEARTGRGRLVVIEGPAGIGKTALLAAARARAAEGGMRVLRSRATELERDFVFGVVRQLFEPPLAEASELERADLLQGAAGVAAALLGLPGAARAPAAQGAAVDPSFAILHGLYWLCVNLAATGPLCLAVDDAHWADAASLRYLAFLLTRLEELEVVVAVALRPREAGVDAGLLGTVTAEPSAEVIRLPPLTRAAVAQLVESRFGWPADPIFVDACLRATRGTPFLLRQLVDAMNEGGVAPTAEAARHVERVGAQTVGRSIRVRLRRLPEHAGRLARALAVLEQGDLFHAARLAGLGEEEAADAADLLAAAGMLEAGRPLTFIHPIVRSAIYSELSDTERTQGHGRAARLLAEQPGANERVAEHLIGSEPAADGWVVERLAEAARAARRQGAPDLEAVYLRRALEEPPPAEELPQLVFQLGIAEAGGGLEGWDEHLRRAVEIASTPRAAARAASALGRALYRAQRFADAVDVLDRGAAALSPLDAEFAHQLQATAVTFGTSLFDVSPSMAARRKALRDHARADPAAPPDVLGSAAFVSVLANEPAEFAAELAVLAEERLVAGGDRERIDASFGFFARMTSALSLLLTDRYEHVGPLLDAWIAEARASADSGVLAAGLAIRGWLGLRRGELSAAEADTRMALSGELPAPQIYRILNRAVLVETLVEVGDLDAAQEELAWLEPEVEKGPLFGSLGRFGRGRLRIEQGRATEALEDFLAVGAVLTRAQIVSPVWVRWRSEAALASLFLGKHAQARTLAEEEVELAQAFGVPRALGVAKRAAGIVAGGERGEVLLREAVDDLGQGDARLERARALADLGAMLRRRNRRTEARKLLREALDAAHRAGARRLAERAETELRATGARPRRVVLTGLDSLTASELRIAELTSGGLTNREIAQTLFITDRTVEGHLTSVFRKLELDSRNELPAALAKAAPVSA
jgi:DNA-binding CsgD family transcriptional regulator